MRARPWPVRGPSAFSARRAPVSPSDRAVRPMLLLQSREPRNYQPRRSFAFFLLCDGMRSETMRGDADDDRVICLTWQMYAAFSHDPCDTREAIAGQLRYLAPILRSRLAHP